MGPTLPRDAAAEHLSLARSAVVNAAMAAQVRRSLEAWEAQRRWAKAGNCPLVPRKPLPGGQVMGKHGENM